MATVHFTRHLKRFFPSLAPLDVEACTVAEAVARVDERFPGLADYVVDERGRLRKHVNIFVDGELIADRDGLADAVGARSELHIMQALSGG